VTQLDDEAQVWFDSLCDLIGAGKQEPRDAFNFLERVAADRRVHLERAFEHYQLLAGSSEFLGDPPGMAADSADHWIPREGVYWKGLENHLLTKRASWSEAAVAGLASETRTILAMTPPPGRREFSARGLVLGYVQSGKTTSYTSLAALAADCGYGTVIVLAGLLNNLRLQTQGRLITDLVRSYEEGWDPITGPGITDDFDSTVAGSARFRLGHGHGGCNLIVMKKHPLRLAALRDWLLGAGPEICATKPILVIDDEADHGSVNTAPTNLNPTAVNGAILEVLDACPRVTYVAYTATPFANLLIPASDPGQLYPRDFIYDLRRPENYFGPEAIFGLEQTPDDEAESEPRGRNMVQTVDDADLPRVAPTRPRDRFDFEPELTESLAQSVRYFWVATAARKVRQSGTPHSSMLINTAPHPITHERTRRLIEDFRDRCLPPTEGARIVREERSELRETWLLRANDVDSENFDEEPVTWEDLLTHLPEVIGTTEVITDNSNSTETIVYDDDAPRIVIAIGGNTLSRGLTLEGLVSTYFVRQPRAYDTLLQMGRWFGYRSGYEDLPRIWMTDRLKDRFREMASIEAEIRSDIARYRNEGLSPEQFAVRIRRSPGYLITARNKMRFAVPADAEISFEGSVLQTTKLYRTESEIAPGPEEADNSVSPADGWIAARDLIRAALAGGAQRRDSSTVSGDVLEDVPHEAVRAFLDDYPFVPADQGGAIPKLPILDYMDALSADAAPAPTRWNVAILRGASNVSEDLGLGDRPLVRRSRMNRPNAATETVADIKALLTDTDLLADLRITRNEAREALDQGDAGRRSTQANALRARSACAPDTALLVIYPIEAMSVPKPGSDDRVALDADSNVIGFAIVFPGAPRTQDPRYVQTHLPAPPEQEFDEAFEAEEDEAVREDYADPEVQA
jgi:hypothetical protein